MNPSYTYDFRVTAAGEAELKTWWFKRHERWRIPDTELSAAKDLLLNAGFAQMNPEYLRPAVTDLGPRTP